MSDPWMLSLRIVRKVEVSANQVISLAAWAEQIFPCDYLKVSMITTSGGGHRTRNWSMRKTGDQRGRYTAGWLVDKINQRKKSEEAIDVINFTACYGLDSTPQLKEDVRAVQWLCHPEPCFPESVAKFVETLCVAVRLDKYRGAVIQTIVEGMKSILPICCQSDPDCFGVLDVERASHCAFGTEPQCGTLEVGVQRQVLHRLWEIKLREEACVLPHVAWVNVMPAELMLRLGKDLEEVRSRLIDIVRKRDVEHMVRIETLALPAGAAAVMILPIHFDNVNDLYETEYADATHMLFCEVLYDVTKWWRAANVIA